MVSIDDFRSADGTRILWGKLAEVLVGATVGAFFTGLISLILRVGDAFQALVNGLAEFTAALVQLRLAALVGIVEQSWRETLVVVEGAGPLAFAGAVGLVLATLYIVAVLRPSPWGDDS